MINEEISLDLLKNTNFEVMTDSRVLNNRRKVRTPLESINCLLGGGFPLGIVAHAYGSPKVGKSTLFYQTMGNFQKDYPDGISIIVDMESSADPTRLSALGVDVKKVLRLPATSIENGFISLKTILGNIESNKNLKDVPIFVIWDTISKGLATDSTIQSRMAAMDRARIIKGYMGELQSSIEKHDFFLGLLNQVIYTSDKYGNRKVEAGGGIALRHDMQISLYMEQHLDNFDELGMLNWRDAHIAIDKSKISPEMKGLYYIMDATKGGKINERMSFSVHMQRIGVVDSGTGGWYSHRSMYNSALTDDFSRFIMDHAGVNLDKKHRWKDYSEELCNNDLIYTVLSHIYSSIVEDKFSLQRDVMREYHLQKIQELKDLGIKNDLFSAEEFDSQASKIINKINGAVESESENSESVEDAESV